MPQLKKLTTTWAFFCCLSVPDGMERRLAAVGLLLDTPTKLAVVGGEPDFCLSGNLKSCGWLFGFWIFEVPDPMLGVLDPM